MQKTLLTPHGRPSSRSGVALVLVLAFIALLTVAIVAFFSRATDNRQISSASANHNKVETFAFGAVDTIIGDLKQEIVEGSRTPAPNAGTANSPLYLYVPRTNSNAVPAYSGIVPQFVSPGVEEDGLTNLLKVSVAGAKFYPSQANSRIANDPKNATTTPSQNGHYISMARWNKPLLMPATGVTDLTPTKTTKFPAPAWALVARDGSNPGTWDPNMITAPYNAKLTTPVTGRFAYAIYDEGGLLDANAAGSLSASNAPASFLGRGSLANKNSVAQADLTQLTDSKGRQLLAQSQIDALIGWRNYATAAVDNSKVPPQVTALGGQFPSYDWTVTNWTNYFNNVGAANGSFLRPINTQVVTNQTDRRFTSRQQFINFILNSSPSASKADSQAALQYLGTFSRDLEQPSYLPPEPNVDQTKDPNYVSGAPVVISSASDNRKNTAVGSDHLINPAFIATRVQTAFTRNDNSSASVGEPLMKNRFALNRLAWLTYLGPIADGSGTGTESTVNANFAIQTYAKFLHDNYGLSWSFLQQGTKENIYKYFGLSWVPDNRGSGDRQLKWFYSHRSATGKPLTSMPAVNGQNTGVILRVGRPLSVGTPSASIYVEDNNREPDFFEILKATVAAGSKAAPASPETDASVSGYSNSPAYYQSRLDRSLEYAIIQLGANMIDQFDLDGYPTHIVFDDGSLPPRQLDGIENLPYLYQMEFSVVQGRKPVVNPGNSWVGNKGNETGGAPYKSDPLGIVDPGYNVALFQPVIWNPHDQNGTFQNPVLDGKLTLYPTNFRFVMNSVNPDQIGTGYSDSAHQLNFSGRTVSSASNANETSMNTRNLPPKVPFSTQDVPSGGFALTPSNSALSFVVPDSGVFREPTLLGSASASTLMKIDLHVTGSKSVFIAPKASAVPSNHPDLAGAGLSNEKGIPSWLDGNNRYAGVYAASFPAQFYGTKVGDPSHYNLPAVTGTITLKLQCSSMTYRLQYQDPNTSDSPGADPDSDDSAHAWSTYDTKYADGFSQDAIWGFSGNPTPGNQTLNFAGGLWGCFSALTVFDPRTSRFGLGMTGNSSNTSGTTSLPMVRYPAMSSTTSAGTLTVGGYNDFASGTIYSLRPDYSAGFPIHSSAVDTTTPANTGIGQSPRTSNWSGVFPVLAGMAEQNILSFSGQRYDSHRWIVTTTNTPTADSGAASGLPAQYFTDPDGIVRRGMGAYVPIDNSASSIKSSLGLPMAMATKFTNFAATTITVPLPPGTTQGNSSSTIPQAVSRPVILNRPFANVGELGHVFSGTPWRNVDLSTPESGDAALLDVFCINNTDDSNALVAGKVNLNTRQISVLTSILSGTALDAMNLGIYKSSAPALNTDDAKKIATALVAWTTNTTATGAGPLANVSELVGKYSSNNGRFGVPYSGFSDYLSVDSNTSGSSGPFATGKPLSTVQRLRDSVVRSLGSVGTARVWNLMIDVVAQTGRYPYAARGISEFYVEGEQRYWVHLAIDRYTGQVLDRSVELVKE